MKRLIFAACAALALAGCGATPGVGSIPTSPAEVADKTVLDEQGALAAELAYQAAGTAIDIALDAGLIRGELATRVAVLDRQAYEALGVVRSAYDAGNGASYELALIQARAAVTDLLALAGRSGE